MTQTDSAVLTKYFQDKLDNAIKENQKAGAEWNIEDAKYWREIIAYTEQIASDLGIEVTEGTLSYIEERTMNTAQRKRFNGFLQDARMRYRALNNIINGKDEHKCDIPYIDMLEDEYADDAEDEILRLKMAVAQIYLILTGESLCACDITSILEDKDYEYNKSL